MIVLIYLTVWFKSEEYFVLGQVVHPNILIRGHYEFHQKKNSIEFVLKSHVLCNKFYINAPSPYKI